MTRSLKACCMLLVAIAPCLTLSAEPRFPLPDPGVDIVDYENFGYFTNEGLPSFQYVITNRDGLAEASGLGVDPSSSIENYPPYKKALAEGKLDDDWWAHVQTPDPQLDLFVWYGAGEDPGVRQFYMAKILERSGHYVQALKAYRAAMILYPDSAAWSSSGEFSWSIAEGAWNQILNLTRKHPEVGMQLVGANVTSRTLANGLKVSVTPGRFVRIGQEPEIDAEEAETDVALETAEEADTDIVVEEEPLESTSDEKALENEDADEDAVEPEQVVDPHAIVETRGEGTVQFVKYANGDWEMLVEGEPYFVKAVVYDPTKVGTVPWEWNWMWADDNTNGIVDIEEVWMDENKNNNRDVDEPVVGDFALLKEMGGNTIKTYNKDFNILLMRRMFDQHGIRVIVGDFVGAYCHDSGASWEEGTDYNSRDQKARIKEAVRVRVEKLRDEPWLLAWILGNENNMPSSLFVNATRTNANKYPEAYARFLNELAQMIHGLDPNHPVGVGNLMTGLVEYYQEFAPALDFIGVNCYIGPDGFGSTWEKVKNTMDRPVLITEYGCDSYYTDRGPDEEGQADYHMGNWRDIAYNRAGGEGAGNSIGGCAFEWVDEWWKDNKMKQVDGEWVYKDPLDNQHTAPTGDMAFPDGKTQEEWLGITGQGTGAASPFQRVPKKAYYAYREVWTEDSNGTRE